METVWDYGKGASTGLEQTASGKIQTGLTRADLEMSETDAEVLRGLARQVKEIAESPQMGAAHEKWRRLNKLIPGEPVIFCDPENGWNEIITDDLMCCRGKLARRWEMDLRKEIFWGRHMNDDKPVAAVFDVPYTVSPDDWGLQTTFHKAQAEGSFIWDNPVQDYGRDLPKLHSPQFAIDWETTNGCLRLAEQVFGGILAVRLKGVWWWSLGLTLPAALLRGLSNIYMDFIENPAGLKELLAIISRGHLDKLDYLEREGLLSLNNDASYVGSGGYGITDQLPGRDFAGKVRCRDMWGFCESQETVQVSPGMYEEFIFPYEKPILERFGLNCYGCCEPLHSRWHVVSRHANLRRISCSPWADLRQMAEQLGEKYILSVKVNPADVAAADFDAEAIRQGLRSIMEQSRGCVVEVIMKDNHTIGRRPTNLTEWCRIAREEAPRVGM